MKLYQLKRNLSNGTVYAQVVDDGETYPLVDVGQAGFEYGYYGYGPGNLGRSILAHFLREANLTQNEKEHYHWLSYRLRLRFAEDMIATLNRTKVEHEITEAAIRGWFKMRFPEIDLKEYIQRRNQYRADIRTSDRLIEEAEGRGEPTAVKFQPLADVSLRLSEYETWFMILVATALGGDSE